MWNTIFFKIKNSVENKIAMSGQKKVNKTNRQRIVGIQGLQNVPNSLLFAADLEENCSEWTVQDVG